MANLLKTLFIAAFIMIGIPTWGVESSAGSGISISGQTQSPKKITLKQLEDLLKSKSGITDEDIAQLIREYGVDFRLTPATLDRLRKLGLGRQAGEELEELEEKAAVAAAVAQPRTSLDKFNSEYQAYSRNPDKQKLDRLLSAGNEILKSADAPSAVVRTTVSLALAMGQGMVRGFFTDLDQSRAFAERALNLLSASSPNSDLDKEEYEKFRTASLGSLNQFQGLYFLRQETPDPDRAIDFLSRAAESKNEPAANDPNTYWLRMLANDLIYQKRLGEYQALPKGAQRGSKGRELCEAINPLVNRMVDDITQVLLLSSASGDAQLRAQADAKLKSFLTTDRPCLAGRTELIDELPEVEARFALIIGVEEYIDNRIARFNYAASDAKLLADALAHHAGFKPENVTLVATGGVGDRQPLRSVILKHLVEVKGRLPAGGLLFVFFAGHWAERDGKTYLLPADAVPGSEQLLADTAIGTDRIRDLIAGGEAEQVFFIIDAFRLEPLSEIFLRDLAFEPRKSDVSAYATLLSTGVGYRSYDSAARKRGHFVHVIVETFKGMNPKHGNEITLDELVKSIQVEVPGNVQVEHGAQAQQKPHALIEGYESEDLVIAISSPAATAKAREAKPAPVELLNSSKNVFIKSNTIYLKSRTLEEDLNKLPEFKSLRLAFVKSEKEADLIVDLNLPFLTWTWNYSVRHASTGTVLASGKVRELAGSTASQKLAAALTANLHSLRKPRN